MDWGVPFFNGYTGDPQKIGELLTKAQKLFDQLVAPACPSQLASPILHRLLSHSPIQRLIFGGKGVGSQVSNAKKARRKGEDMKLS